MVYYVNMDGIKLKFVSVKDLIIGLLHKINAVRSNKILIDINPCNMYMLIFSSKGRS